MTRPELNKRITAATMGVISKYLFAFVFFCSYIVVLSMEPFIRWLPFSVPFVGSFGLICLCFFLWLTVSGTADLRRISLAREIEDKLYAAPITVKDFSNKRKNPGVKRFVRGIASLRKAHLFSSVAVLEDCIVFERGRDSRPLYLTAEKGMRFVEGSLSRSFLMPVIFFALAFAQRFWEHGAAAVVIPLVFAALSFAFTRKSRGIFYKKEAAPAPIVIEEAEASGDSAADALIKEGKEHLRELARLDTLIMDKPLSKNIAAITAATRQLLELLSQSPQKHSQARQLVEYALPTTIKLIKQYDYLERQPVKGDNIKKSMNKIVEMSGSVVEIMQKELDALYSDKTVDIEVDIEVLKGMLQNGDMDINKL